MDAKARELGRPASSPERARGVQSWPRVVTDSKAMLCIDVGHYIRGYMIALLKAVLRFRVPFGIPETLT